MGYGPSGFYGGAGMAGLNEQMAKRGIGMVTGISPPGGQQRM